MYFRFWPLLFFAVGEVLLFNGNPNIQLSLTILEYLFIGIVLLRDAKSGVMYLTSFTLLAMGGWSYVIAQEIAPATFWALRVGGFSANIIFTLLACCFCIAKNPPKLSQLSLGFTRTAIAIFIGYAAIVGIIAITLNLRFVDNFYGDLAVFAPYFLYVYMLSLIDQESVVKMIKYGIALTVITMVLSFLTKRFFDYGDEYNFVLMNGFAYVVPFGIFFMRRMFSRTQFVALTAAVLYLLATGAIFLGGKAMVILIVSLLWGLVHRQRAALFALIVISGFIILGGIASQFFSELTAEGTLTGYKMGQLADVYQIRNLDELSVQRNSIGNLAAEARTVSAHLSQNGWKLIFGQGLGGGTGDVFGYLSPAAGPGAGYSVDDVNRNEFVRMHLPIFNIALRAGLIGVFVYLWAMGKLLVRRDVSALIACLLLGTVFTNSKEMMLLLALFITAAEGRVIEEVGVRGPMRGDQDRHRRERSKLFGWTKPPLKTGIG